MKSDGEHIVEQFFNLPPRSKLENHADTNKPDKRSCASLELIWQWLGEIPDPEIPVISLVDLGIIRQLEWQADVLVITITPTYSGCPATRVIQKDIELQLRKRGITRLTLQRQLSPAWTTDWISAKGRERLRRYGIAPPQSDVSGAAIGTTNGKQANVICPRCQSDKTRKVSHFGSTPCKASYQCNDCLEPFEYFKCL